MQGLTRTVLNRWLMVALLLVFAPIGGGLAVAAQSDSADGTPANLATYEGGAFGFTLDYDPGVWEVVDEASDGVEDYAVFAHGPGFVTLTASAAYGGDIAECQEDWVRYLRTSPGIEDYRPLLNEDGDVIAVQEEGVAYAAYAFRSGDGNEFFHIECLSLIADVATLAIVVEGFVEDYSPLLIVTQVLLGGLDATAAAAPEPAGDGTGGAGGDQGEPDETPGRTFADAFDDPAAGFLSTASPERREADFAYDDGEFVIQTLTDDAGTWQAGIPGRYADATIAVDVRLAGDSSNRTVLIGCRSSGGMATSNEYVFSLRPDSGALALTRWNEGEPTTLEETVREDLVALGEGTNRMELACIGATIVATVNAEAVFTIDDDTYLDGGFFLGAGVTEGEAGVVDSRWDNLEVSVGG